MIKKLVILAGGRGTRFLEETHLTPKPMINIGNFPIILHIMKYYSSFGVKEFIVCGGYKVENIKQFFLNLNYFLNDIEIDYNNSEVKLLTKKEIEWNVKIVDTGINTMTGGRLKKVAKYLEKDENFFLTYGDGLSNVNLNKLSKFHQQSKNIGTLTIVLPPGRFGSVATKGNQVTEFFEKPKDKNKFINGGFFVFNKKIINYIKGDKTILEDDVLTKLTNMGKLQAYKHTGFWQTMDSLRDKIYLDEMWNKNPFWKKSLKKNKL